MSPKARNSHWQQQLIAILLMTFATLCIHGLCQSNHTSSSGSPSLPPIFQDPSSTASPQNLNGRLDLAILALEAKIEKLAESVSQLHSENQRPRQHIMTAEETVFVSSLVPMMIWLIAVCVFMDGAYKASKDYMMNTMLCALLCANFGMAYLIFGMGDSEVRWHNYVLGIFWPMQGIMAASAFMNTGSRAKEVGSEQIERKNS